MARQRREWRRWSSPRWRTIWQQLTGRHQNDYYFSANEHNDSTEEEENEEQIIQNDDSDDDRLPLNDPVNQNNAESSSESEDSTHEDDNINIAPRSRTTYTRYNLRNNPTPVMIPDHYVHAVTQFVNKLQTSEPKKTKLKEYFTMDI